MIKTLSWKIKKVCLHNILGIIEYTIAIILFPIQKWFERTFSNLNVLLINEKTLFLIDKIKAISIVKNHFKTILIENLIIFL